MNKYLKQSKNFPPHLAKDILLRLQFAKQEQALLKKKQLLVNDDLFDDGYQASTRDQRSTLFYGVK